MADALFAHVVSSICLSSAVFLAFHACISHAFAIKVARLRSVAQSRSVLQLTIQIQIPLPLATSLPVPRLSISPTSSDDRARSLSRGRSRSRSRTRSESPLKSTKIVVERLTKNVTEEHLREIFGQYGPIDDMDVPLSRQFGTNRGAAYILYVNEVDAEAAIAHMHEAQLDGATISVSIVLPRRKFSPPPPTATHGANYDPRLPPPGRGGRGPRGPPGMGGMRGRGPRGGGGGRFGRGGPPPPSDTYRPRSASRSRSPAASGRGGKYRARSPSYSRSRSRTPQPPKGRRGRGRYEEDYDRRRSPSRDSYGGGYRGGRSRSRDRRSYR
ncbi:hypothetical protein INS49_001840 [Diaporthe citri]|uniref:uncharacterized protein n=1 Tax=Diaporthe citri TaxID=83186 RepID=UPI001C7E2D47|nr:uncharacterized protein INS49_001840 [Diaporthe citri]KAG6367647.1 hypothetical protein INS49_001840 [Diaporthe citri]